MYFYMVGAVAQADIVVTTLVRCAGLCGNVAVERSSVERGVFLGETKANWERKEREEGADIKGLLWEEIAARKIMEELKRSVFIAGFIAVSKSVIVYPNSHYN